jgi:hypothetical protein
VHDAIGRIAEYTANLTEESFAASTLVQDAIIRQVQIIGAAAARLSEGFSCSELAAAADEGHAQPAGPRVRYGKSRSGLGNGQKALPGLKA